MPWPLPTGDAALLALAKSYPFETFPESYLLLGGQAVALRSQPAVPDRFAGRVPVIAHGSNRSPAQLARKFGDSAEIPVTRAWLRDYDVVYSAHMSRYGSIAANVQHAPGVVVEIFVTWLDDRQLIRMHETELGGEVYVYGRMAGIELALEAGPAPSLREAFIYLSRRGCLAVDQQPVALAEVPAKRRGRPALTQVDVQSLVCGRHGNGDTPDAVILRAIRDPDFRRGLIAAMGEGAVPTDAPHFTELHR